jgi:DNA recombination protein RmuC
MRLFTVALFFGGALVLSLSLWVLFLIKRLTLCQAHLRFLEGSLKDAHFEVERTHLAKETLQKQLDERTLFWEKTQAQLEQSLKGVCADVIQRSSQTLASQGQELLTKMQLITQGELGQHHEKLNHLVAPVTSALAAVDQKIRELECTRVGAYEALTQQMTTLAQTHKDLHLQTHQLARALRSPHIRGRWGEIQLRRLIELAGMLPHCDFEEQASLDQQGRKLRPDVLIHLPENRTIIIDAKVPLLSYIEGIECEDPTQQAKHMKDHGRQIRQHIKLLGHKSYWSQCASSPEFVLLFLPSETLLTAALEDDKTLLEYAAESQVLLVTPMTLVALLKTVALGWHHHNMSENAQIISVLGRDLSRKLSDFIERLGKVGHSLSATLTAYNGALQTLEEKVMPPAKELSTLTQAGTLGPPPKLLNTIPLIPRPIASPLETPRSKRAQPLDESVSL